MKYTDKLLASIRNSGSVLCAGLDPFPDQFPPELRPKITGIPDSTHATESLIATGKLASAEILAATAEADLVITFCRRIIEQTKTGVAAYKLNLAYYEALGPDAFHVLDEVLDAIPSGKIIIADAKRGDVPHTNARYKAAYFDRFGFDAITLSPFMGTDTLIPFLGDATRAVYALTLTSNPGAADLMTHPFGDAPTLSAHLASLLKTCSLKHPGTLGMVIGATQSEVYGPVMEAFPEAPLLIPGIGAQGGSIPELEKRLAAHPGIPLINVSRGLSAFDPKNHKPWDIQIATNTDLFNKALQAISKNYTSENLNR